ncbi:MAG: signal peptidase II [Clostridia bacterium]|jgi:signal peptidase II
MLQAFIVFFVLVLDQTTKYLSKSHLMQLPSRTIPILRDVFHLSYVENYGAAFGILQNGKVFLIAISFMIIGWITYYLFRHPDESLLLKISLSMVLGGAIGNLIDRIRFGYVIDFLDFRLINYPVFNIADCSVVVGTILLSYYLLFVSGKNDHKQIIP